MSAGLCGPAVVLGLWAFMLPSSFVGPVQWLSAGDLGARRAPSRTGPSQDTGSIAGSAAPALGLAALAFGISSVRSQRQRQVIVGLRAEAEATEEAKEEPKEEAAEEPADEDPGR